jgi:hypothetical protein
LNPDGSVNNLWTKNLDLNNQYDRYAVMAYAAESKTTGLGATANVGFGFTTAGQVNVRVDFSDSNKFTNTREDHSGQFNSTIIERQDYWNVLMKRFGLAVQKDSTTGLGGRL